MLNTCQKKLSNKRSYEGSVAKESIYSVVQIVVFIVFAIFAVVVSPRLLCSLGASDTPFFIIVVQGQSTIVTQMKLFNVSFFVGQLRTLHTDNIPLRPETCLTLTVLAQQTPIELAPVTLSTFHWCLVARSARCHSWKYECSVRPFVQG